MLWNASGMIGYAIDATDGAIGSVDDCLFDDRQWVIRWIAVDTGGWLPGRNILLPPSQLGQPDAARRALSVALTRRQVEDCPEIGVDPPVSRQEEARIHSYYGWEPYWESGYPAVEGIAVPPLQPPLYAAGDKPGAPQAAQRSEGDPHLRGTREVTGYYIHASDGDIGHVEDFLVEADGWAIRYMVVDTRNWWPGKKVLVAPQWVTDINWSERTVRLAMTRQSIKGSPEYRPSATVDRAYEEQLYSYYGRPHYWF